MPVVSDSQVRRQAPRVRRSADVGGRIYLRIMLVIKVELWPGGRPSAAHEIGRAAAANVSALSELSDYVAVLRDDSGHHSAVRITGHRRDAGFWPLLARIAESRSDAGGDAQLGEDWQDVADAIAERMYQ